MAGVCALLSGQPFYRVSARSPTALAALTTALLGSAGHQSPKAAQIIASMFITFSVGFIRPPALSYAQVTPPFWLSKRPLHILCCCSCTCPRISACWRAGKVEAPTLCPCARRSKKLEQSFSRPASATLLGCSLLFCALETSISCAFTGLLTSRHLDLTKTLKNR